MTNSLAEIVMQARIQRLSLIGLAKNVGKTTTVNHLCAALLSKGFYQAEELGLTSLGLDGEAREALTGLPKPRYVPQTGLLVATTTRLLAQAEAEGARFERLMQLPGNTSLGPVLLARVLKPGFVVLAGPNFLRGVRYVLDQFQSYGARLGIVDGAINRIGTASPAITDACIVCTGASVASLPETVARCTTNIIKILNTPPTRWHEAYRANRAHLSILVPQEENRIYSYTGLAEPVHEAEWIIKQMSRYANTIYMMRGALTAEFAREFCSRKTQQTSGDQAECVIEDPTKIFCRASMLQQLAARGLHIRVARPVRVLAITVNPYTPSYTCTSAELLEALHKELPEQHPPLIDVVSSEQRS